MYIEYSLNGFMRPFFRHFLKFAIVFAAVLLVGVFVILTSVPTYEARGSFLVKFGANARPDVSIISNNRPTELAYKDRNEIMNSYVKILQSQNLIRKAIEQVGVTKIYSSLEDPAPGQDVMEIAANAMLYGDLRIITSGQSNVIEIYVTNKNPDVAAEFVDSLMKLFISAQARVYEIPEKNFLVEQIDTTRGNLEKAESDFLKFKEDVGVSDLDGEMLNLQRQKTELMAIAFKALTEAQQKLSVLEAQAEEASATYRPDSSVMQRLTERVETAREQIRKLELGLEKEIAGAGALSNQLGIINNRISHIEENRATFNILEQKVKMASKNLEYYTQLFEEARANNVLNTHNISRITVVDKPFAPSQPIRPRKKIILALTILAAGFFGLALVVVLELLDERYTTPDQLAKTLGMPVLMTFDQEGKS